MATRPQPTEARPTAGSYAEPTGMNAAATAAAYPDQWDDHAAFDAMDTAPEMTAADGGEWTALPDQ
jgi:hypothetical protein